MSYYVIDQLIRNVFIRKSTRQTWNWEKSIDFVLFSSSSSASWWWWWGGTPLTRFRNRKASVQLVKHHLSADIVWRPVFLTTLATVFLHCNVFTTFMIRHCWPFEDAQEITSCYTPLYVRISYDFLNKYSRREYNWNYKRHFFPPGGTTHCGFVFCSPLAGYSLLAYEASWSHTTTRHTR